MALSEPPVGPEPFRKKVLIVDDSPVTIALFDRMLADGRFQTIRASDGKEAVERAFAELPDVILMDIMMPEMNGSRSDPAAQIGPPDP